MSHYRPLIPFQGDNFVHNNNNNNRRRNRFASDSETNGQPPHSLPPHHHHPHLHHHHHVSNCPMSNKNNNNTFIPKCNGLANSTNMSHILKEKIVSKINLTLNQYRKDSKLCDFELRIPPNKVYPVHKVILSAASPYFEAMFSNKENFIENCNNFVEFKDIEFETIEQLLEYIYTGEIEINSNNVQEIARVSSMFELVDLCKHSEKYLESCIKTNNCIGILCFADFYGFSALCFEAKRFAERNFAEVIKEDEFLKLPSYLLKSFLKSENLSVYSEFQVLGCTLKWILKDEKERIEFLEEFINIIRMPLVTNNQIQKFIDTYQNPIVLKLLETFLQPDPKESETNSVGYNLVRYHHRLCSRRTIYLVCGVHQLNTRWNDPCTMAAIDKFDIHNGIWSKAPSPDFPRCSQCVVQFNDKLFVFGGECESLILDSLEIFDPDTESWIQGAQMKQPRSSFGACVHDSYIYAFGGIGDYAGNTVEQYDPKLGAWKFYDEMPISRYGMQVIQHDGIIYLIGGANDKDGALASVLSYNPITKNFTHLPPLHVARSSFACTIIQNRIYVIGGCDSMGNVISLVESYNISEKKWNFLCPMDCCRASSSAISINNLIYVFGGQCYTVGRVWRTLKMVDIYDPERNAWHRSNPMPFARSNASIMLK